MVLSKTDRLFQKIQKRIIEKQFLEDDNCMIFPLDDKMAISMEPGIVYLIPYEKYFLDRRLLRLPRSYKSQDYFDIPFDAVQFTPTGAVQFTTIDNIHTNMSMELSAPDGTVKKHVNKEYIDNMGGLEMRFYSEKLPDSPIYAVSEFGICVGIILPMIYKEASNG